MNHRQRKKDFKKFQRKARLGLQQRQQIQANDVVRFDAYASTPNGSARLVAFHDAVVDAQDTLEAVERAIDDGDLVEAQELIRLGQKSLAERIAELKELL